MKDNYINNRQKRIKKVLMDDGFVMDTDPRLETKPYECVLTRKLKNNDVIRVILDSEGEEDDTMIQIYVFDSGYKGLPLSYDARFSFNTPLQAVCNFITSLG